MPVTNVNLLGAVAPQGLDLQTQQAQLLQAQKIAEMLIGQGMEGGGSPVIHTGGNNPFARDVANWHGPLAAAMKSVVGQMRLGKVNEEQQALAQEAIAQREEGMGQIGAAMQSRPPTLATQFGDQGGPGDALPNPTPDQLTMTDPGQKGGFLPGIMAGLNARSPEVRALAQAWLGKRMDIEGKQAVGGNDFAAMARAKLDPTSYPSAMSAGQLTGAPLVTSPENFQIMPETVQTAPNSKSTLVRPGGAGAGQVVGTITNEGGVFPPGTKMPDGSVNNTPFTLDRTGHPVDSSDPKFKAQEEVAKGWTERMEEGQKKVQSYVKLAPRYTAMINLLDNAQLGITGEWQTKARQLAIDLGLSKDEAGKVVDVQTLMKFALPQAAENSRNFNSRSTQLEFQKFSDAAAANQQVDPRAAANIFKASLIDGLNEYESHTKNIDTIAKLPQFGASQANSYRVPVDVDNIMKGVTGKSPFKVGRDEKTGYWSDQGLGSPESHVMPNAKPAPVTQGLRNKYNVKD